MKKNQRPSKKLKAKALTVVSLLNAHYPANIKCYLGYDEQKPWQLLIATILSAQCTDNQVNRVTPGLFARYETLADFAGASLSELERAIYTTGFYRNKAKSIQGAAAALLSEHGGELPAQIEALTKLPGVGRKTANVVRGHIFGLPSIVVDTHVKRISTKLGLVKHKEPDKIEFELMAILPESAWIAYNTQVIAHGRAVCRAKNPDCDVCFLQEQCLWRIGK